MSKTKPPSKFVSRKQNYFLVVHTFEIDNNCEWYNWKLIKKIEVDVVLALAGLEIGNFVRSNFNGCEKVHILRP
jgi:hypothetical protein